MQIHKPRNTADYTAFIGRKGSTQSMQAITDSKRRFVDISPGWPGSVADVTIWRTSPFYGYAVEGEALTGAVQVDDPRDKRRKVTFQHYLIGDGGYKPCTGILVVPYHGKSLPAGKEYFNFKLSSARMRVEQAFGILKNRWRMLFGPVLHDPSIFPVVVTAACILHNLLIDQGDNVMQFIHAVLHAC